MPNATDFETLLRRTRRRDRVPALVAALGLEPAPETIARADWSSHGLADADTLRSATIVARRGTMAVLLLELATDADPRTVGALARRVREHDLSRQWLFLATDRKFSRIVIACLGLEGEMRHLAVDRDHVRRTDAEALAEMVAVPGENGLALALRYARALDRSRVTRRFFEDFRAQRASVAAAWRGVPPGATADREQLALLFLCRLLFLYFLQRRGHLACDGSYLPRLFDRWRRQPGAGSFYRGQVVPLFFGALNTKPEHRDERARALGELPYLNGGLFERHATERRHPRMDLPDAIIGAVFDELLERYRFTTRDTADQLAEGDAESGIDPEMLGRVFEEMMSADRRGDTGTFYTPATVVDRMVGSALAAHIAARLDVSCETAARWISDGSAVVPAAKKSVLAAMLKELRVLDPACGSGAFLLGALSRLARLRGAHEPIGDIELRRQIVGTSLHGVDLLGDAALLCALRLWLALAVETDTGDAPIPPLPNLDRRIRQGDALIDPLDLAGALDGRSPDGGAVNDARVRRALAALAPASGRYLCAEPRERAGLQRELARRERALAGAWIGALDHRIEYALAERRATAAGRDLWGERTTEAESAAAAIPLLRERQAELGRIAGEMSDSGTLPFFSFGVHFGETAGRGFDLVVSNPPWVRAHRWPAAVRKLVRRRYLVCREPGWRAGTRLSGGPGAAGGQVDLSLLFLERALGLLAKDGTVGMMLPAKSFRSLYGGPARRMLMRGTRIAEIEDHSLDQRSVFEADAFAGVVIATRVEAPSSGSAPREGKASGNGAAHAKSNGVRITLVRRHAEPLRFETAQDDLPLVAGDHGAPWLLAPPRAREAIRRMQAAGPPIGSRPLLRIRRGIFTGLNDVLLVREAVPKLGDLARIRTEGWSPSGDREQVEASAYEAIVEATALRPILRGADVSAWRYESGSYVIWVHDDDGSAHPPPPRLRRFLTRHDDRLCARTGARPGHPAGAIFRLGPGTLGPKVAWHDLSDTLNAVALPPTARCGLGLDLPLVPLNTLYFIPVAEPERALILSAYLNSLPVRTFARAIAERAKDARFRFFAWTVGILPLPEGWDHGPAADRLGGIAAAAHADRGITVPAQDDLDALVQSAYSLSDRDLRALRDYDQWLRGES